MIKLDTSENQAKLIYLGIGSNLGNRKNNIDKAKFKLSENNISILRESKFYETLSWPNKAKPKFINVVLLIKTRLSAHDLLKKCLSIEKKLGRKRIKKNEPRSCDIDIIDYDSKIIKKNSENDLSVPHPRMHKRNFVLLPLFEISKSWVHPLKKTSIKDLINSLKIEELRAIKIL